LTGIFILKYSIDMVEKPILIKEGEKMIELGKVQKLEVVRFKQAGAYLNSKLNMSDEDVLLPRKQVPEEVEIGDEIEVFVYRDSEDRMIATTRKPKMTIGQLESLEVVETTEIGAFLDWGLEKDLFLPFKEQTSRVIKGRKYLVGIYIDKSDRLCATMNINKDLSNSSPFKEDDKVNGTIYGIAKEIGAFVAVDNKYRGLIPNKELYGDYKYGDKVEVRITKVKEDGKLDLSLRKKAYRQMDDDTKIVLDKINLKGGKLSLNDHSSPDIIKAELNMSKRAFKRAVGRLLKEEKIRITKTGIELVSKV
jgi:predicted RNA-binding protein (virulence factor B family)